MASGDDTPLVTAEEVKAAGIGTGLSDGALEDYIDRESAWLARRIGPLAGERAQLFYVGDVDRDSPLLLARQTDAVEITDGTVELDDAQVRLLGEGTIVERADGLWTGPTVEVVYTPSDELEVIRVLLELLRLGVSASPYESEQIGEYRYSRGNGAATRSAALLRDGLLRELLPLRRPGTIRLRSSVRGERIGAVA